MRSAVENGSDERCLPLKIFVVFNPALLVESVPGILQLAINGCWLDCFLLICTIRTNKPIQKDLKQQRRIEVANEQLFLFFKCDSQWRLKLYKCSGKFKVRAGQKNAGQDF